MGNIRNKLFNLLKDEEGLELSEYAVAGALIVVVAATVFTDLGNAIRTKIGQVVTAVNGP